MKYNTEAKLNIQSEEDIRNLNEIRSLIFQKKKDGKYLLSKMARATATNILDYNRDIIDSIKFEEVLDVTGNKGYKLRTDMTIYPKKGNIIQFENQGECHLKRGYGKSIEEFENYIMNSFIKMDHGYNNLGRSIVHFYEYDTIDRKIKNFKQVVDRFNNSNQEFLNKLYQGSDNTIRKILIKAKQGHKIINVLKIPKDLEHKNIEDLVDLPDGPLKDRMVSILKSAIIILI